MRTKLIMTGSSYLFISAEISFTAVSIRRNLKDLKNAGERNVFYSTAKELLH